MKTTMIKTIGSAAVLAGFLLIALATQFEDEIVSTPVTLFQLRNQSDSCTVQEISLIFRGRRDDLDTMSVPSIAILPGDSLDIYQERERFTAMLHACHCPDSVFLKHTDFEVDTNFIARVILDCY
jgi:hypothetical protein